MVDLDEIWYVGTFWYPISIAYLINVKNLFYRIWKWVKEVNGENLHLLVDLYAIWYVGIFWYPISIAYLKMWKTSFTEFENGLKRLTFRISRPLLKKLISDFNQNFRKSLDYIDLITEKIWVGMERNYTDRRRLHSLSAGI